MGSFGPSPLEVAVLLGWTVVGAVREGLSKIEARLRPVGRPTAASAAMPRVNMFVPASAGNGGGHLLN
jgi:hypothetical protein